MAVLIQAQPRKLLIRCVNWLGDAVMTTPALLRLREALPGTHIALLTREKLKELWEGHPAVDAVHTIKAKESVFSVGSRLRQHEFDTVLVLPNSFRCALEARLARIPRRIGHGGRFRRLLLTDTVLPRAGDVRMRRKSESEVTEANEAGALAPLPPAEAHQIHDYLHLGAVLGAPPEPLAPYLRVSPEEIQHARSGFLAGTPAEGCSILFGINPGAEYGPAKRWPPQNFAAVMREVSRRQEDSAWLVFGGPNDVRLAEQACQNTRARVVNLAGKTALRELMCLLALCDVLLSNDTGPAHAAAALGTPLVIPFGSTSPELTGPGLPGNMLHAFLRNPVPCAPCFRRTCGIDFRCMTGIPVSRVVESLLAAAARRQRAARSSPV